MTPTEVEPAKKRGELAVQPVNMTSTEVESAEGPGSWINTLGTSDEAPPRTNLGSERAPPLAFGASAAVLLLALVGAHAFGYLPPPLAFLSDPAARIKATLAALSPSAATVYFGALYVFAELIAIPATPLTLMAGCLFGTTRGAAVVLVAGAVAAALGFGIGRAVLRERVEGVLDDKPAFRRLDRAVGAGGRKGLRLLVLARLAPVFPFSLLNYFYGASSIPFPTFLGGTLLGFVPTTLIYVYTGLAGKELVLGGATQPWFVYVGSVLLLLGFLKLVTDVATDLIQAVDDTE